jgi:hypothetical protein
MIAPLHRFRLAAEPQTAKSQTPEQPPLALSCGADGPALAGAPLLRKGPAGFTPLPPDELAALTLAAYGELGDLARLTRGLAATAAALNRGDLPLAMTAAVHLRLPDVTPEGAVRLSAVAGYLVRRERAEPAQGSGVLRRHDTYSPRWPHARSARDDYCAPGTLSGQARCWDAPPNGPAEFGRARSSRARREADVSLTREVTCSPRSRRGIEPTPTGGQSGVSVCSVPPVGAVAFSSA